jgi:hypothetical protein
MRVYVSRTTYDRRMRIAIASFSGVPPGFDDDAPLYARVDSVLRADGAPMLMELDAIEPNFSLNQIPATAAVAADAILAGAPG